MNFIFRAHFTSFSPFHLRSSPQTTKLKILTYRNYGNILILNNVLFKMNNNSSSSSSNNKCSNNNNNTNISRSIVINLI